jgi:menaquinone-dependent protoporphyrinogen oxidase
MVRYCMTARILLAYASKKGSTAEIAEAIGKELRAGSYQVDVCEMNAVSSVSGYDAIVLGGPVYMGRMVGDVGRFIGRHREVLHSLPVAAFAVGLAPVSNDPSAMENALRILMSSVAPVKPVGEAVFAGRLDPDRLSFVQRWMIKQVKSPVGDFRDWEEIGRWAKDLPEKLGLGHQTH